MATRASIIQLADTLIRKKGYNAFSFNDISKEVGIKTASIHYHFPTKSDLGVAVIQSHIEELKQIIEHYQCKSPVERLEKFLDIYTRIHTEGKVCLVGSLCSDLHTVDESMKQTLHSFAFLMLDWVTEFLEEGRCKCFFRFNGNARTKAMMIIGNMLAAVQLSRLTGSDSFNAVKDTTYKELTNG